MKKINQIISCGLHHMVCLGLLLCLAMMTGCAIGPDFQPPQTQVPDKWTGPTTMPATELAVLAERDIAEWWTVFQDPTLTSLVERAVESNLDMKLAEARIRQARAARGVAVSDIGPKIDATGSFRRSQSPGSSGSGAGAGGNREGPTTNQYQSGFDAGWELDIFGGVRRGVEAADADLQATMEMRRDVLVTLAAEMARNYIDLRVFQERIAIARQNLKAQQHSAELTRQRFQTGFVGGLDVANANAQVATTAARIPVLETSARQTIYSLSVLLGREPAALMQELSAAAEIPAAPPSVPVGVPSELLRRHPDIRRAEAEIHAATARIGVATADLFPKVMLSGSIGYQDGELNSLFDPLSRFWSLGSLVSWQVFDTGRISSNIEVRKALEEQSVIAYQQMVLAALQEVENALIASAKEQEHRKALVEAVAANRKAVELATKLYSEGQTDFLNVLSSQRSLYLSEDTLAQSTRMMSTNLVALYKVFGVRPNSAFLYTIPATGDRPMKFAVENIPKGLTVNSDTGNIKGILSKAGTYRVTLVAQNKWGKTERNFRIVVGDTTTLTPPMGWNSWNCWAGAVDAKKIKAAAQAMKDTGLINHGWTYINIDDTWQGKRGGPFNAIQGNEKFPDIKGLCDYVHGLGLKIGIYSTPWVVSYAGYLGGSSNNKNGNWEFGEYPMRRGPGPRRMPGREHGKYSFAKNDAKQWAEWGIDYLKYDWKPNDVKHVEEMSLALRETGRDTVYSLSNSADFEQAGEWARLSNCWRTTGDIKDSWESVSGIGLSQSQWAPYAGPGHWNDPDMLAVGQVGWGPNLHPSRLSPEEQYTHISLWCLLSAPLLLGCDLNQLDEFTLNLLTNDEVLQVDQDPLGKQATCIAKKHRKQIWAKDMEDGSKAVGLFNLDFPFLQPANMTVNWQTLGIQGKYRARDLWRQKNLGVFEGSFTAEVPAHGVVLVRISPKENENK